MKDNSIGDEGAEALSDVLKNNSTLTKLDLPCKSFTSVVERLSVY